MSDEKVCLKWNDFEHFAIKSFNNLREEKDFFDVTLVSEDQVQFESHKVVLSASSKFFKNILRLNMHNHPLLYLHGVHSTSLQLLLDYVYQGEVKVFHEQIDTFLNVAANLKISGLQESVKNEDSVEEFPYVNDEPNKKETSVSYNEKIKSKNEYSDKKRNDVRSIVSTVNYDENTDTNIEELLEKISEMTEKVNGIFTCKVCHKTAKDRTNLGKHIESHIDGITLTCEFCSKKFRSRESLRVHKIKNH